MQQGQRSVHLPALAALIAILAQLPALAAGIAVLAPPPALADDAAGALEAKIAPHCLRLYEQQCGSGRRAPPGGAPVSDAVALFALDDILLAQGRIRLQVDTGPDGPPAGEIRDRCKACVPSLVWEGSTGRWGQVVLELRELPTLAALAEVFYVLLPPAPHALDAVLSAGLGEIGALDYHATGLDGGGIRIGVVDLGFARLAEVWGTEIPTDTRTRSFYQSPSGTGDLSGGGDEHGTACAEIVHDVAPGARLYLANVYTAADLEAAVEWMQAEGVAVISHSVGWFFGPGDGTGTLCEIVHDATDAGILWINSAGNQARMYWEGDFSDTDADGVHEFDLAGDEGLTYLSGQGGQSFSFVLTWDRWPYSTDLAFRLEVYEEGVFQTASDELDYGETWPYAFQAVSYGRNRPSHEVEIRIARTRGDLPAHVRLFRLDHQPIGEHNTSSGSLVIPADSPRVLSVGAYRVGAGFLEDFSSRGPNQAGTPKPELCAPDGVETAMFPTFGGTSAACPHAAGAVALLHHSAPPGGFFDFRWTVGELRALLAWAAEPEVFIDPDACDWGLLRLPALDREDAHAPGTLQVPSPSPLPLRARIVQPGPGPLELHLYDTTGRLLWQGTRDVPRPDDPLWLEWPSARSAPRLPSGCYLLAVRGRDYRVAQRVLVVR